MVCRIISFICFLSVSVFQPVLAISANTFSHPQSQSQRWALLIGIGEYEKLKSLPGSLNDIEIISYVLSKRYGFKEKNITFLKNEAATREGIIEALERIVTKARESDIVYIHYSGHGSQVKDLNGDEFDDDKDETLVPYDGRAPNVPDITDDKLNELLSQINAQRVIVSIDACHSGSVTRGAKIHTRSVPPDTRLELYRHDQRYTRGSRIIGPPRAVVFSSSTSYERALDGRVGGRYHGYFSYALFRSLLFSTLEASPPMVFDAVKKELHHIKNLLHRRTFPAPQLKVTETLANEPLFPIQLSSELHEADALHFIRKDSRALVKRIGDHLLELEPARYLGGLPSSVWEIIPANIPHTAQGKDKILAKVITMKGMNAVAEVSDDIKINFDRGYAQLVQPTEPPSRISLLIRELDSTLSKYRQEIQELFQRFSDDSQKGVYGSFVADIHERDIEIFSADGVEKVTRLSSFDLKRLPTQLNDFLKQSLPSVQLRQLQNPDSSIRINARLLNTLEDNTKRPSLLSDPTLYIRGQNEPTNKFNSLQLEVWINKPSFLTILDVDSEGAIRVLFPSPFQESSYYSKGFIPSKTKVTLPDSLDSSNRAGFVWDIGEPRGRETLYIFASSDELVAKKVRQLTQKVQHGIRRVTRSDLPSSCAFYDKLRDLLYSNPNPVNAQRKCGVVESEQKLRSLSRGSHEELGSQARSSYVQNDWNAVTLDFWVKDSN